MQTELDRISNQNHLQMMKALLPHLPVSNRKHFSVLIKIIEVQNVIRFYNTPPPDLSDPLESPDLLDVLTDMRCYCEGEEQQMIDQVLQMMSMVELFSMMSQENVSQENNGDGDLKAASAESDACNPDTPFSENDS